MTSFRTLRTLCGAAILSCACAHAQLATTTSLTVTQAGAAVTSVAPMTAVTLTATVLASGAGFAPGQVTFCDAAATYCTDIHALGTVQLSSTGVAKLTLLPGKPGAHSYQAKFLGTHAMAASASVIAPLTVSQVPSVPGSTVTSLTASGQPGNYTLTATVTGNGTIPPTGTVSFVDVTNANYVLGTATLGPAAAGLNYIQGASYATGSNPGAEFEFLAGDFNNDGFPDLVSVSPLSPSTLTVLINKGDGSFTILPSTTPPVTQTASLAVGDFNGDGNLDLVFGDTFTGAVAVLLGNGDGTFRAGFTTVLPAYSTNNVAGFYAIGVGDFNHDGIADLALVDPWSQTLRIMLGKGDGSFTVQAAHPATGVNPIDIAVADFNGDGNLDLIVCNIFGPGYSLTTPAALNVFLGAGDGTFTKAADVSVNPGAEQIFAANFDSDGKLDLAVNDSGAAPSVLQVFSGNGDGTFAAKAAPQSLVYLQGIGIGDLNADGHPDFGGAYAQRTDNVAGLIGNGDGTFAQTQFATDSYQIPALALVADFKGTGYPEIAIANQQVGITIMEPRYTGTVIATVTGISPVGTGTHYADAVYGGDTNNSGSTSNQVPLTAQRVVTALTLTANSSTSAFGQSVTLTATLNKFSAQNHTATQNVTFSSNGASVGTAPVTNGVATLAVSTLAVGVDTLTAAYAGDTNFAPSASGNLPHTVTQQTSGSFTLALSPSTLTLAPGASGTVAVQLTSVGSFTGPLTLTATSLSGLIAAGIAPPSVSLTAGGTGSSALSITASLQASNEIPANPASRELPAILAAAVLFCIPFGTRHRRKFSRLLGVALVFVALQSLTGCTNSYYTPKFAIPATPRTYQVTVTATDVNQNAQTATLTVTVTP